MFKVQLCWLLYQKVLLLLIAEVNTYLIWEGEQVYLGYLTKIDYQNSRVSFILNKGGIIEKVDLELDRSEIKKKQE
jgi:hypothetical protein